VHATSFFFHLFSRLPFFSFSFWFCFLNAINVEIQMVQNQEVSKVC
jgi:hypothetical protein